MEPYERVVKAVKHERADRPASNFLATPETTEILKKHLRLDDDEAVLRRLGADIRYVSGRFSGPQGVTSAPGVGAVGKDFWGVVWEPKQNEYGHYNEIAFHPLAEATTVKEIEDYAWPSVDWFDYSHLKDEIAEINREHRYAIDFFVGGAFESPWYMRGMERFLMDLVEYPDIAEAIVSRVAGFYKQRALKAVEQTEGALDMLYSGGDIGTQRGMMLAPDLWRQHIKPYTADLIRTFKDLGFITFYHSCGSMFPVIEDLIESGLDILDPIQPKAADMDADNLKKHFGNRLTFHGGIDEQDLLPNGSADEVRAEVLRLINVLGSDGGYIVCPAHAFQPDTPPENIMAVYDTVQEFRYS